MNNYYLISWYSPCGPDGHPLPSAERHTLYTHGASAADLLLDLLNHSPMCAEVKVEFTVGMKEIV